MSPTHRVDPSGYEIRSGSAATDEARDAYVRAHPRGTFFHLAGWRRAVENVMGHANADLLAYHGDELVGVLPLMACKGLFGKTKLISMPYAVYGGALGDSPAIERALTFAAERDAVQGKVARLELRHLEDAGLDWPKSELYATFIRDLPDTVEGVLASMPKKSRAEARKARDRHGLELSEGDGYLADLLRLFHRNKHSLGSPGLPAHWFEEIRKQFPGQTYVHLVRRGNEPLAAVMSFTYEKTLLAYYSGTGDGVDRAYSASNFMYLALQEWCVERGYEVFDFGRSRKDSGAFRFKTHQGFTGRDLHYAFRLVRDTELPSLNPSNPATKRLRDTWSRLPAGLAERLSTPLARFLP